MLTCMVSACCSQWVRAKIRTTNCLVMVVSHRLLSLRSSSWLAAYVYSWWLVMMVVGTVLAVLCCGCVVLSSGEGGEGFKLGCQSAWRPRCNHCGVALDGGDTLLLLLCCGCVFLGSLRKKGARARSSSCLAAELQSCWCCQHG